MSGLPDMYTRSPRAADPRDEDAYIRQTTSAHGITTTWLCNTSSTLKICQTLKTTVQRTYIVRVVGFDCKIYCLAMAFDLPTKSVTYFDRSQNNECLERLEGIIYLKISRICN